MPKVVGQGNPADIGVLGKSKKAAGVSGVGEAGSGVSGYSDNWFGVYGESCRLEGHKKMRRVFECRGAFESYLTTPLAFIRGPHAPLPGGGSSRHTPPGGADLA